MPTDLKISELPVSASINGDDTGILVSNGADYQFTFARLLQFVISNFPAGSLGSAITFTSDIPQNNIGKNGDVAINPGTQTFYQKVNGVWTQRYQVASAPGNTVSGNMVLYGLGMPAASTGSLNDTYINTGTGIFYKKTESGWIQVFTMLNGPAGGPGPKGDQGIPGVNGKTILNGTSDPSNLNTGSDGDFYINTRRYTLFGPKTNGDWGSGIPLADNLEEINALSVTIGNLAGLQTSNKANLVSAINEVLINGGGIKPQDIGQGLIISNNKLTLDLESKQLVSPSITPVWTLYKNDGTTSYSANSGAKTLIMDKGVKANLLAKYRYPEAGSTQATPLSTTGALSAVPMPAPGIDSDAYVVNNITANQSYGITLQKPKSGLIVSGTQVGLANGYDTASDSVSISFQGRGLLTAASGLTTQQIQTLYNNGSFQTSRARTFTGVTAGADEYIYYIYDAALTPFTAVIFNDAEAYYGAFQFLATVTIVNNAGVNTELIVARSNATNAFTNAKLAFS